MKYLKRQKTDPKFPKTQQRIIFKTPRENDEPRNLHLDKLPFNWEGKIEALCRYTRIKKFTTQEP